MPGKPEPSWAAILAAAAKLQRIVPDAVLVGGTHGWVTARVSRPVMVLGSLDGVETGIRNLIRLRPLEVEVFPTPEGPVRVPTLAEMARIKAWLVLKRNATRDYLDLVALLDRLGPSGPRVLVDLDTWYADQIGTDGERVATQLAKQLAEPKPYDLSDIDLGRYRRLDKRWHDWSTVAETCRVRAGEMLALLLEEAR